MTARLVLIALLLWGTTEAAVCRAYCLHVAEFSGAAAAAGDLERPAPGAPACHGHDEPSSASPAPRSQPQDSDGSGDAGCCPELWFAAGAEASSGAGHAPAFFAEGTLLAVACAPEGGRRALAAALPPEPLRSPFRTQNPPLLS
jgi:hypothetical protein